MVLIFLAIKIDSVCFIMSNKKKLNWTKNPAHLVAGQEEAVISMWTNYMGPYVFFMKRTDTGLEFVYLRIFLTMKSVLVRKYRSKVYLFVCLSGLSAIQKKLVYLKKIYHIWQHKNKKFLLLKTLSKMNLPYDRDDYPIQTG